MHYGFLRLCAGALPLLAWFAFPIPAYANSAVSVDCGDGAPISGTVDAATLAELQGAVQAMVDNPSGMTCTLGLPTALDPLAGTNDPGSFVVGGGRYGRQAPNCPINFSISGHVDQSGVAHGTQTATENNTANGTPPCPGEGHVKANVTCVAVSGNRAEVRGDIIEQSGSLGPEFFPPGQTVLVTDVQDNGKPSTGVPDQIVQFVDATGTDLACQAPAPFPPPSSPPPPFPVDNGNITVHD